MALDCSVCGKTTTVDGANFCTYCGEKFHDPYATISHVPSDSGERETVPDATPPVKVGGYKILKQLGEGGMGTVFEAEADDTGKRVAVKLLSKKLSANPVSVERFRQEGRLASQLSHPRCVFVYSADADAGRPFIVMELMPGQTLKDVIEKTGCMSTNDAVDRILDVIDGLIEAHRLGLIHRDVKPSNCFITADNRVKIGDFGLSKSLVSSDADAQLTGTGAFLGTVLYAPPEQIRGEDVSYDSDVYSVCATLYYLLTARAPYQHESMTAALARAISEPPPSLRRIRPDVPKVLDKVVRKGLERDRYRRYSSLEELRDALQQLQPEEQVPARTRMLLAAYSIDAVMTLFLVQVPVETLEWALGLKRWLFNGNPSIDPFTWVAYVLYFAACEGFAGATIGKWLLGLRVVPHGSVGPPGFGLATLRSSIFHLGWLLIFAGFVVLAELPDFGILLSIVFFLGGIAFLAYRKRTPTANRGLHDILTKCHVVQLPRRPHRVRLVSHAANRLDQATVVASLPPIIGGFTIRGRIALYRDGSQLILADDRSLGRRVLMYFQENEAKTPPNRPTRLRLLSSGEVHWNDHDWFWHAYAAPAGSPLADMVPVQQPLTWPDARLLLEQVVEELKAAEVDGSLPQRMSVNNLWCEPGGRVFLLDFPIPSSVKAPSVPDSLSLVRQTATLTLEGRPRFEGPSLKAPLPPRASTITNRLFDESDSFANLGELQSALAGSHAYEPLVTMKMRATQLGLAAVALAFPMLLLVLFTQFVVFLSSLQIANLRVFTAKTLTRLEQPEALARLQTNAVVAEATTPERLPETRRRLTALRDESSEEFGESLAFLSRPERYAAVQYRNLIDQNSESVKVTPASTADAIRMTTGNMPRFNVVEWRSVFFILAAQACGFFLAVFAVFAFVFRGGISYLLSGITLVRTDGRKAGRFRCALREIVLWLPFMLALIASAAIQAYFPGHFLYRLLATVFMLGVLIAYVSIGIRNPQQGPHDRLFGTWRVPA